MKLILLNRSRNLLHLSTTTQMMKMHLSNNIRNILLEYKITMRKVSNRLKRLMYTHTQRSMLPFPLLYVLSCLQYKGVETRMWFWTFLYVSCIYFTYGCLDKGWNTYEERKKISGKNSVVIRLSFCAVLYCWKLI